MQVKPIQSLQSVRQPISKLRHLGLAVAIVALSYQPARAELQQLTGPTPTIPTVGPTLAVAPHSTDPTSANLIAQSVLQSEQLTQSEPLSGSFVNAAKRTSGGVTVIEVNGTKYLELDEDFRSDSGPDLFVLLHNQANPSSYRDSDFVNLGRLQEVAGTQLYEIPAGVDPAEFESVVIWCRQFGVTFGFAEL